MKKNRGKGRQTTLDFFRRAPVEKREREGAIDSSAPPSPSHPPSFPSSDDIPGKEKDERQEKPELEEEIRSVRRRKVSDECVSDDHQEERMDVVVEGAKEKKAKKEEEKPKKKKHQKPIEYIVLSRAFDLIEKESGRLKIMEIMTMCFLHILQHSEDDLLPSVYLANNSIAPPHEGLELGVGSNLLMKAMCEAYGRTMEKMKGELEAVGDLGSIASRSRGTQRTLFKPQSLTIQHVFNQFRVIARDSGKDSMQAKKERIKSLLVAARESEAQYVIRSLEGKLRIGMAEQSVLVSIAHAVVLNDYFRKKGMLFSIDEEDRESFVKACASCEEELASAAETIKIVYNRTPSFDVLIPALLEDPDFETLKERVPLQPGIPMASMLARPSNMEEVLDKFVDIDFTCEYKYDGERAQVHRMKSGDIHIFSRNAEDHTDKYPDLVRLMSEVTLPNVESFVIDCEVVAYDVEKKTILPFQKLSTRGRKNITEDNIKVQVCLFPFDMLFFNGASMLDAEYFERRKLLHTSFETVESRFAFAKYVDVDKSFTREEKEEAMRVFLTESLDNHCEGLMVKAVRERPSIYEPGKRSAYWMKVKKDYELGLTDSLDLVPIGAYYGRGKRTGVYGAFLLASYNEEDEEYQSICKIGTGFSEENLAEFKEAFSSHIISEPKRYYRFASELECDVWFDHVFVWEVRAADLSISPKHMAAQGLVDPEKGIALRFPRFIRIRTDKEPTTSTNTRQVVDMYRNQASIR
eukprot:TRINITY_DN15303_c0_g1_i1.p1 TRINITY_DN15303_c0_g1~~TRINITY_DN15303_c0_g1_i1.p1  ORF type:complete len:749 (-),score=224.88 TRINITY_DN15303_c0_g1_i1:28-2274(-)